MGKRKKTTNSNLSSNVNKAGTSGKNSFTKKSVKPKTKNPYTKEQCAMLKSMTLKENKDIQCKKCGEFFHDSDKCPRSGPLCFKCYDHGHFAKDCKGILSYLFFNDYFNKEITFLIDCAESHHIVGSQKLLIKFVKFEKPKKITTLAIDDEVFSLGEGFLPVYLEHEKSKIVLLLKQVQYVPDVDDYIISCGAFNEQFKTTYVLNVKTGFIVSRRMKTKLTKLYAVNRMFRMKAIVHGRNYLQDTNYEFNKYYCNTNLEIDKSDCIFNINENEKRKVLDELTSNNEVLKNQISCYKTKVNRNQKRMIRRKLSSKQLE